MAGHKYGAGNGGNSEKKPFYENIAGKRRGPAKRAPVDKTRSSRNDRHQETDDRKAPRHDYRRDDDRKAPRHDRNQRFDRRDDRSNNRHRDDERNGPRHAYRRDDERNGPRHDYRRDDERNGPRHDRKTYSRPFEAPKSGAPVFAAPAAESEQLLARFLDFSLDVLPLDSKKLQQLPNDIRDLSHELTDERSERRKGYMNDPATLSAYIRYYQWWNLVRLVRLFTSLPLELKADDVAADLGSGPLTVPIALWIARPDLREIPLTWYCVDISGNALSAGEELFLKIAAETGHEPWTIIRVKGTMGVTLRKKVAFVASANMFNEMYLDDTVSVFDFVDAQARDLASYALPDASILVVEPGIPRAANFVSLMRRALKVGGYSPVSPCPHSKRCPFTGERGKKWCHFVFDAAEAPEKLKKLSEQAGLAKDRAALSFVFSRGMVSDSEAEAVQPAETDSLSMLSRMNELFPPLRVRIVSDPIRLPGYRTGRYGCSDMGMVLVTGTHERAAYLDQCSSGSLIELQRPDRKALDRDAKSGALLLDLDQTNSRPAGQSRTASKADFSGRQDRGGRER